MGEVGPGDTGSDLRPCPETVLCRGENLDSEARGRVASDQCVTQGGSQHFCGQLPHCKGGDNKGASPWGC